MRRNMKYEFRGQIQKIPDDRKEKQSMSRLYQL